MHVALEKQYRGPNSELQTSNIISVIGFHVKKRKMYNFKPLCKKSGIKITKRGIHQIKKSKAIIQEK